MCKKKSLYNYLEANAPIYSVLLYLNIQIIIYFQIICIQNYVIVSVGGGGKRFGIENRLVISEMKY